MVRFEIEEQDVSSYLRAAAGGALIHRSKLIIPYGLADDATGLANLPLAEVLAAMEPAGSLPA